MGMDVRETVTEAMRMHSLGSYIDRAAPVITALEDRERSIVDSLLEFAEDADLDMTEVRDMLRTTGLPVPSVNGDRAARIDKVEEQLTALLDEIRSLR